MVHLLVQRRVVLAAVAAALSFALASPAAADDDRGNWEFTLAGAGTSDKDFDNSQFSGDIGLGFFLGPINIGVRQTVTYAESDFDLGGDYWSGSTRPFVDLQFDLGPVSPFIGVNFGYVYGDLIDDQFIAGPEAGLKLYVGDDRDTFIFARVEYQFFFEDSDDAAKTRSRTDSSFTR